MVGARVCSFDIHTDLARSRFASFPRLPYSHRSRHGSTIVSDLQGCEVELARTPAKARVENYLRSWQEAMWSRTSDSSIRPRHPKQVSSLPGRAAGELFTCVFVFESALQIGQSSKFECSSMVDGQAVDPEKFLTIS